MTRDAGSLGGVIGNVFGVPMIESPFVPPGQAYVLNSRAWDGYRLPWQPSLYSTAETSIKGHIERKANEIRRRWGMAEVDYAAEAGIVAMRRRYELLAETRLALQIAVEPFRTHTW